MDTTHMTFKEWLDMLYGKPSRTQELNNDLTLSRRNIMIPLLIATPFIAMLLGMAGGQGPKWLRRFVMPTLLTAVGILVRHYVVAGHWYQAVPLLVLMAVFVEGYGEKSWIYKWLKIDWEIRSFYSLLTWIPIAGVAFWCGNVAIGLLALPALIFAFDFEGGKWFSIGTVDILWDDIVRYFTVGVCALVAVA